jgi:Zn finger protein HypA/HybF involved in hydrogenase expression
MDVAPLNRTLDQELAALIRGVSLECLVCGEFVLHVRGATACPECKSILAESEERIAEIALPSAVQAG